MDLRAAQPANRDPGNHMIRYRCPECGEESSFSDNLAGTSINCPKCRVGITVPRDAAIAPAPAGMSPGELARVRQALDFAGGGQPTFPGNPRPFLSLLLGSLGSAAAFLVLTWFLAGNTWLNVGTLIASMLAGIILVPMVFALGKEMMAGGRDERRAFGLGLLWALLLAATAGAALGIHAYFPIANIHIDNATGKTVRLKLDGNDWVTVQASRPLVVHLRRRTYALEILDADGKQLDSLQAAVNDVGPYILNVLGKQVYARGSVQYGGFAFGGGPHETEVRDRWFKADVDYLFTTPPSSITVRVRRGQAAGGTSRTFLRRGNATKGK